MIHSYKAVNATKNMKKNRALAIIPIAAAALLFASCGTKKSVVTSPSSTVSHSTSAPTNESVSQLTYVQKVFDRQLYQKNIVGDMTFSIKAGSVDHSLPGSLHMRKDEVIRLQVFIPLLGSEIGRLEFTPDYVLILDRIHKEYIKADYNQLDFLKKNGLNFYSLQSLFWNQLLLPGVNKVTDNELKEFQVNLNAEGATIPVTLKKGKMSYQWNTSKEGMIVSAVVDYNSDNSGKSTLTWNYDDFKPVGVKQFPATQSFTFTTNATNKPQSGTVTIEMDGIGTDANWNPTTTISSKYKQVDAKEALNKLLKMQ